MIKTTDLNLGIHVQVWISVSFCTRPTMRDNTSPTYPSDDPYKLAGSTGKTISLCVSMNQVEYALVVEGLRHQDVGDMPTEWCNNFGSVM